MNPIVMITGASSGFGAACAEKFASHGYDVIITARREDRLTKLKKSLESKYGIKVLSLCFDVQQMDAVNKAIGSIPDAWKKNIGTGE